MKTILPWVVAVLAIGGLALLFKSNQSQSAELAALRVQLQQLESLRSELAEAKAQQVPAAEVAQLRKDREALLRLRNEIGQLRNEKQELTRQAQTAQSALANAQAETERARQQAQAAAQASQAQSLVSVQNQQQAQLLNACINNLRQLDGAKQQWALENRKADGDVPSAQDIALYLKDQVLPACPAGGSYTLNGLGTAPTCSIAGHVLPPTTQ